MKKSVNVPITVTFRHLAATDALRARAEKKIGAVVRLVPGATDAHVVLATASHHHRQRAEVIVNGPHSHLTAHAETDDMYASIDQVAAKLDQQAHTLKGRVVESSRRSASSRRTAPPAASSSRD